MRESSLGQKTEGFEFCVFCGWNHNGCRFTHFCSRSSGPGCQHQDLL